MSAALFWVLFAGVSIAGCTIATWAHSRRQSAIATPQPVVALPELPSSTCPACDIPLAVSPAMDFCLYCDHSEEFEVKDGERIIPGADAHEETQTGAMEELVNAISGVLIDDHGNAVTLPPISNDVEVCRRCDGVGVEFGKHTLSACKSCKKSDEYRCRAHGRMLFETITSELYCAECGDMFKTHQNNPPPACANEGTSGPLENMVTSVASDWHRRMLEQIEYARQFGYLCYAQCQDNIKIITKDCGMCDLFPDIDAFAKGFTNQCGLGRYQEARRLVDSVTTNPSLREARDLSDPHHLPQA